MYNEILDTIGFVSRFDPEVGEAMQKELGRQQRNIELIASENFVSPAVMAAMGSVLTNNMQRDIRASAIMVVANMLILLKILRFSAQKSCLVQIASTSSPTPAHRRIWRFILL